MLNLDTHILLYALSDQLRPEEKRLLSRNTWSISTIVFWEISKLCQLGRIDLDLERPEVTRILRRIHSWPLSLEVCRQSCALDFSSDPADELIAATSIVHEVALVTRDRKMRRSRRIPLAAL